MNLFGFSITRNQKALETVPGSGGWMPIIRESFPGAWQRNITVDNTTALSFYAVYSCITLIAGDISKLGVRLVAKDTNGIWQERENAAYSPVIRKPNPYQTRIQFWESWILSKLMRGNTYVLKARDNRNIVTALYVLNPDRVQTLVSDDGQVFYRLSSDNLAGVSDDIIIPAREVIHDRMNCLFHPLVGISPLYASALSVGQGIAIQKGSSQFFANGARPSGALSVPGNMDATQAQKISAAWNSGFTGDNQGKVAILTNGMTYTPLSVTAEDAQLVEQLKMTAEQVCSVFHVPPFMIGAGPEPTYNNVALRQQQYYAQALQVLIEAAELCFDEGLGVDSRTGIEFDLEDLLRMDMETKMRTWGEGVTKGLVAPDEGRGKLGLPPTPGGDTPYLQEQNYSLAALAKRDAKEDPWGTVATAPAPQPSEDEEQQQQRAIGALFEKELREAVFA